MKVLRAAFLLLLFGKKALSYEKCAHKMLMKLTPGVNFDHPHFSYFCADFILQKITNPNCKHIKAWQNIFLYKKAALIMKIKIETWAQFHQHIYKQLLHP